MQARSSSDPDDTAIGAEPSGYDRGGDGKAALRDAIDAGILDVLGPVTSREEFARRLTAIGIADRSDTPL